MTPRKGPKVSANRKNTITGVVGLAALVGGVSLLAKPEKADAAVDIYAVSLDSAAWWCRGAADPESPDYDPRADFRNPTYDPQFAPTIKVEIWGDTRGEPQAKVGSAEWYLWASPRLTFRGAELPRQADPLWPGIEEEDFFYGSRMGTYNSVAGVILKNYFLEGDTSIRSGRQTDIYGTVDGTQNKLGFLGSFYFAFNPNAPFTPDDMFSSDLMFEMVQFTTTSGYTYDWYYGGVNAHLGLLSRGDLPQALVNMGYTTNGTSLSCNSLPPLVAGASQSGVVLFLCPLRKPRLPLMGGGAVDCRMLQAG
jgi:hypothetical protein